MWLQANMVARVPASPPHLQTKDVTENSGLKGGKKKSSLVTKLLAVIWGHRVVKIIRDYMKVELFATYNWISHSKVRSTGSWRQNEIMEHRSRGVKYDFQELGDVPQWQSACLACTRSWVLSPTPPKTKNKTKPSTTARNSATEISRAWR